MKVFQIESGYCYWDATPKFGDLASLAGRFPASVVFVEAPDYVFEGWGYDATKEGDERFIQPEAPDGFIYDPATGTFYPEDYVPDVDPEPELAIWDELDAAYREGVDSV